MKNLIFFCLLFLSGCRISGMPVQYFSILNWNAQTFFDANNDGIEYQEFRKSTSWNSDAYKTRLTRLCSVILEADSDIVVLEEIENHRILYDITNQLAGNSWNSRKIYQYGFFSKNPGDAIGIGILSRFPMKNIKNHNLDIRTEGKKQPSMRPIVEFEVLTGGKTVKIFANHWKSKSGGQEETECWRNWQEKILAKLMLENSSESVIACGDFNRDITEFKKSEVEADIYRAENIMLTDRLSTSHSEKVSVISPWLKMYGELIIPGSYWYNGKWERIDHFFGNSKIRIINFEPLTNELWCTKELIPRRYKSYSQEGYSDHLPIKGVFQAID